MSVFLSVCLSVYPAFWISVCKLLVCYLTFFCVNCQFDPRRLSCLYKYLSLCLLACLYVFSLSAIWFVFSELLTRPQFIEVVCLSVCLCVGMPVCMSVPISLYFMHAAFLDYYRIVGNFQGELFRELVKNTIFTEKTFTDCSLLPRQKIPHPKISWRKTFANSRKTAKFVKVFRCTVSM